MKRRDFFTSFTQTTNKKFENALTNSSIKNTSSLDKFSGDWNEDNVKHLLRRALFGFTQNEVNSALEMGFDATIDSLLDDSEPMPDPPIKFFNYVQGNNEYDDGVAIGDTFVNETIGNGIVEIFRTLTVQAWLWGNISERSFSLREKMTLFWTNHFSTQTEVVRIGRFQYDTNKLFRENSLSNFKELVKKVTYDMTMILFLNQYENIRGNPNENYARELLELFTIGKGPQQGPGDYTNYTEQDVIEAAKVLTGITVESFGGFRNGTNYNAGFQPGLHDYSRKNFSEAFQNKAINPIGEQEFDEMIDMIFDQQATAKHIVSKLYRWFVFYDIPEVVQQNVIDPLAQVLIDNDYDVKPVLKELFSSEHFFDMSVRGAMIKNPADFLVSIIKGFEVPIPSEDNRNLDDIIEKYFTWYYHFQSVSTAQEMELLNPPSVAGWEAYYQFPNYYRKWISSVTYPQRVKFCDDLFSDRGLTARSGQFRFTLQAKILDFVESLSNAYDPNFIVQELSNRLLPFELSDSQKALLKLNLVIEGQGDYVWSDGWNAYINDKNNAVARLGVKTKLDALVHAAISLPEFQLM